jgi:4-diphosphocytidyl-2-C-methyl-D-erythritol kinase
VSPAAPEVRGPPPPAGPPDLELEAPAKVNLFLEVLGRRPDGYHEIETVMLAVDLADRVAFWRRPPGELALSVSGGEAPADQSNLALRAARAVQAAAGRREGLHLHIDKRIPAGGGLGGGSSDAAAVLRGLNRLWKLGARAGDLEALGAALGSDVNFFLRGGLAVCTGRGEVVRPLPAVPRAGLVLYLPGTHLATAEVYARVRIPLTAGCRSGKNLLEGLSRDDLETAGRELFNRLEEPVFEQHPELAAARERLLASPRALGALLSGSGSTIYVLAAPGDVDGLTRELSQDLRRERLWPVRPVGGWEPE